eukprot:scaffold107407_cov85-Phaeocystis_antarctica.AAC.1
MPCDGGYRAGRRGLGMLGRGAVGPEVDVAAHLGWRRVNDVGTVAGFVAGFIAAHYEQVPAAVVFVQANWFDRRKGDGLKAPISGKCAAWL